MNLCLYVLDSSHILWVYFVSLWLAYSFLIKTLCTHVWWVWVGVGVWRLEDRLVGSILFFHFHVVSRDGTGVVRLVGHLSSLGILSPSLLIFNRWFMNRSYTFWQNIIKFFFNNCCFQCWGVGTDVKAYARQAWGQEVGSLEPYRCQLALETTCNSRVSG